MDIRPFYTNPVGQAAVQATPARLKGWTVGKVTNGLMLSWPLSGFGEERPELKGHEADIPDSAGVPPLQIQ